MFFLSRMSRWIGVIALAFHLPMTLANEQPGYGDLNPTRALTLAAFVPICNEFIPGFANDKTAVEYDKWLGDNQKVWESSGIEDWDGRIKEKTDEARRAFSNGTAGDLEQLKKDCANYKSYLAEYAQP